MIKVYIASSNPREAEILEMAFGQYSYNVLCSSNAVSMYLEIVQYKPEIVLVELTEQYMDQLSAVKLIRSNRILKSTPIIGFGHHKHLNTISHFIHVGISKYFLRPLKIGLLMDYIIASMKERGLELENKMVGTSEKSQSDLVKLLIDKALDKEQKLKDIGEALGKLMSFPFAITKIMECSDKEDSSAPELSKAISSDSAITSTILKISNSIQFHSENREITEIKDAIVRVGFNEVKNIALGLSVMKIVPNTNESFGFDLGDFWYHSLGVAIIAEHIAKANNYPNPSFAFLAGLLHEFGTLILDEFFEEPFKKSIEDNVKVAGAIENTQISSFGISQIDLAISLFRKWNIPKIITNSIENHFNFETLDGKSDEEKLANIIGWSDLLSKSLFIGNSCDNVVRPISEKQFESSGMKNVLNNKFATTIYDEVKTFASYLSLEAHPMPEPDRIKSKDVNQIGLVSYSQDFNTHLDFLTNLGYQFVKISDPAELSSALANHQIFCVLVNPSDETALTEIDAYEESFKMIGDIEKKPKCHLMSFYSQNSVIQPKDLSDLWVTVSKTSDLRVFEHVLEKIL